MSNHVPDNIPAIVAGIQQIKNDFELAVEVCHTNEQFDAGFAYAVSDFTDALDRLLATVQDNG